MYVAEMVNVSGPLPPPSALLSIDAAVSAGLLPRVLGLEQPGGACDVPYADGAFREARHGAAGLEPQPQVSPGRSCCSERCVVICWQ